MVMYSFRPPVNDLQSVDEREHYFFSYQQSGSYSLNVDCQVSVDRCEMPNRIYLVSERGTALSIPTTGLHLPIVLKV